MSTKIDRGHNGGFSLHAARDRCKTMEYDKDKVDDMMLALLYLTTFQLHQRGRIFNLDRTG